MSICSRPNFSVDAVAHSWWGKVDIARREKAITITAVVHTKKAPKTCKKKPVQKERIEKLAIDQALSILYDDDTIEKLAGFIYEMQDEESPYLQVLKARMSDNEQTLKNVTKAIEIGIITPTTKQRMEELESEKEKLQRELEAEQRKNPRMTKDEIFFGLMKYRELDLSTKEGKEKLIDGFINSIYLYDDKIIFNFNSKGKSRVLTLAEIESSYSEKAVQSEKYPRRLCVSGIFACAFC